MTAVTKRRKWRRWLDRLYPEIQSLVIARHIYLKVGAIVQHNSRIQTPGDFAAWITRNYVLATSVSVRKLCDRRSDSISLYRLLDEIRRDPSVVTRRTFLQLYSVEDRCLAHRSFDRIAGTGRARLPASVVELDIQVLKRTERGIRRYVNKYAAHLDARNVRRRLPTFADLDSCVDQLHRLYVKYERLLSSRRPNNLLPTWQYEWTRVFRIPWIDKSTPLEIQRSN